MKVPFFNYPHVFTAQENEFLRVLKDVGSRGAFIMQQDLQNFEQRIATYCGVKYAVGVANATDGLQLGLMAGGIDAGDEIIICSHTMMPLPPQSISPVQFQFRWMLVLITRSILMPLLAQLHQRQKL